MSWRSPIISNKKSNSANPEVHIPRTESIPDIEELKQSGMETKEIPKDRFTCYKCGAGWHFGRMRTITCTGNDDTLVHNAIIYVRV